MFDGVMLFVVSLIGTRTVTVTGPVDVGDVFLGAGDKPHLKIVEAIEK